MSIWMATAAASGPDRDARVGHRAQLGPEDRRLFAAHPADQGAAGRAAGRGRQHVETDHQDEHREAVDQDVRGHRGGLDGECGQQDLARAAPVDRNADRDSGQQSDQARDGQTESDLGGRQLHDPGEVQDGRGHEQSGADGADERRQGHHPRRPGVGYLPGQPAGRIPATPPGG
ncbi:hypothetical protein QMK19_04130 [Streptomyces sp. H10-C2]|uniref:hypothetical protein n=1 Tax=unclassified Streptomyces TaxID=2593676 RepID=UPI0024BBE545|nr:MULTISPECIES: hypothetical protein [unclassified Streptomyces]MDJ0343533.1 hypothetical protein [Streptomyces sp. PH10-H1]MDJ0368891.1 hypothetical protein [Streptomyces sp. H10-C2]